jgi:hypothetical protein
LKFSNPGVVGVALEELGDTLRLRSALLRAEPEPIFLIPGEGKVRGTDASLVGESYESGVAVTCPNDKRGLVFPRAEGREVEEILVTPNRARKFR